MTNPQERKQKLSELKTMILHETKNVASFVSIGETLYRIYYTDKLVKNQKEFLDWTKNNLGFSKSTTYEYIISYRVYSDIVRKIPPTLKPPMYQSHCQLLAKIPDDQVADIWIEVNQLAPNGITTAILEEFLTSKNFVVPKKSPRKPRKKKKVVSEDEEDVDEIEDWPVNGTPEPDTIPLEVMKTPSKKRARNNPSPPKKEFPGSKQLVDFATSSSSTLVHYSPVFESDQVFETAKRVIDSPTFDIVYQASHPFPEIDKQPWHGTVFCNFSDAVPYSTQPDLESVQHLNSLEGLLQIIFTRYTNKEYQEGIFIIKSEFGADWFTPILHQPICILRQKHVQQQFESFVCFYLGPRVGDFCYHFKALGAIPGYNAWYFCLTRSWIPPMTTPSPQRSPPRERVETKEIDFPEFLNVPSDSQPTTEDLSKAASALCNMGAGMEE